MILKALQILPYILASVNPSTFIQEQPKRASDDTATYTADLILDTQTSGRAVITDNDYYDNISKQKFYGYNQSDIGAIYETDYYYSYTIENTTENTTNGYIWHNYTAENQATSSCLKVLQISPYQTLINNILTASIRIYLNTSPYEDTLSYCYLYADVYTSTDDYWATYVNTTITDNYLPYNAIADITNSENGFIYTKETYTETIQETSTSYINVTMTNIDLYIDPNSTNYYYIYIYTRPIITDNENIPTSTIQTSSSRSVLFGVTNRASTNITGEYYTANITYEVIDVPGLMWEVLAMPFAFISTAFNLTLFPNTPYQINISNLFLSIIGIFIFIFILKLILKLK